MRLQDPAYTKIILVTLAETTPVTEAAQLEADLRRAGIEPFAWVINSSLAATGTNDPLLRERIVGELPPTNTASHAICDMPSTSDSGAD